MFVWKLWGRIFYPRCSTGSIKVKVSHFGLFLLVTLSVFDETVLFPLLINFSGLDSLGDLWEII